jgi:protein adenylyltransferase
LHSPHFNNSFVTLPENFYTRMAPMPVAEPQIIRSNEALARDLGIDPAWLNSDQGMLTMAGNHVPDGAAPLAAVYAGHQFGSYNPQLGDGRAILLGEVVTQDNQRFDIQLKGSGPTPYSRGGDGRSALGPVLREYLLSEAMYRLGVPTTRALAAVTTGEDVVREGFLPGGILARVASSHIRIGSFEYFAARGNTEALRALADHVIARHYPEAGKADNPVEALLNAVIGKQAQLIARWQMLGFIHGVMNTDNMLLCGETVDYGPCAFMDAFNPGQVYSSIDRAGRYAYGNQPSIGHWNLSRLAQSLLPLLADEQEQAVALAQEAIDDYPALFLDAHAEGAARKLGLQQLEEEDSALVEDLFNLMAENHLDFTLTFRQLADLANEQGAQEQILADFAVPPALEPWIAKWQKRLEADGQDAQQRQEQMYQANPIFIPRNHLVEAVIQAAYNANDLRPFQQLADVLDDPHSYRPDLKHFATPPEPDEIVQQTFCGT